MKISIVIPVYNVSLYVFSCVNSILRQSYYNIECVIVDDASSDNSVDIIQKILIETKTKVEFNIIRHSTNKGLSAARNTGIKHSTGDYIYFLDSDDELTENSIETLVSYLKYGNCDIVIGELMTVGANRKKYSPLLLPDKCILDKSQILYSFLQREWYEMAWNKLIKRNLFFDKGCWFYEGIVHEDNLWSFNLAINASTMIVCQQPTYIYHIHPGTITSKKRRHHFDSMLVVMAEMIKVWKTKDYSSQIMRRSFSNYLCNLKIYYMKSLLRGNYELSFINEEYAQLKNLFQENNLNYYSISSLLRVKEVLLEFFLKIKKG